MLMRFTTLSLQLLMLNWKFPMPTLVSLKSRAQGSPASLFCSYLVNWVNFTQFDSNSILGEGVDTYLLSEKMHLPLIR